MGFNSEVRWSIKRNVFREVRQNKSAQARLIDIQYFHRRALFVESGHSLIPAARIIEYSPETLYAATGTLNSCFTRSIKSRYGIAGFSHHDVPRRGRDPSLLRRHRLVAAWWNPSGTEQAIADF